MRRERQLRFIGSPKGRAWIKRNNRTPQAREANARYRQTEKGRASIARNNAKRVFGGSGYIGRAPRAEQAADLNRMARDFRAQQKERHDRT